MNPLLSQTQSAKKLTEHARRMSGISLSELFANDSARFPRMSAAAGGLFMDYSKHPLSEETLSLLLGLAGELKLKERIAAMFAGERINRSENRAALHTVLRNPVTTECIFDGKNVTTDVHRVLKRMESFTKAVHDGTWRGFTGKKITDVVNIGIGGSDAGPRMVCHALRDFHVSDLSFHFVSNADGFDLAGKLNTLSPETTLFIVSSKTFTTVETMLNATSARNWFLKAASESDIAKHFVAVSANTDAASAFGIPEENVFEFWDFVGGRYSVWSAIGLPVMLAIGPDHFGEFLSGAHAMDNHFRDAPLASNMPVLLALIGIWHRNFLGRTSLSIAPYMEALADFPIYMQQLDMESSGKTVTTDNRKTDYVTGPVVWGNIGTDGQHAYFQLLHQGSDIIPVDFIVSLTATHGLKDHHELVLANCFAQAEALMRGKTETEARTELIASGLTEKEADALAPHKTFAGNRPSTMILMNELRPETLGALLALYEHKVFTQGLIWNINSFDQMGVELGKSLAKTILSEFASDTEPSGHDSSTAGLIALAKAAQRSR